MSHSLQVSVRYAKALYELALDNKQIEETRKDMLLLSETCRTNKNFVNFIKSPIIQGKKKKEILNNIFAGNLNNSTLLFLSLLAIKGRESYIPDIAKQFIDIYNFRNRILPVQIKTAQPLSSDHLNSIIKKIEAEINFKLDVSVEVDPDLIGGFSIQYNDLLYDASVLKQLSRLKNQIIYNPFIGKI